jgi:phosphoglycerate-specific signal transduction histidine kinase
MSLFSSVQSPYSSLQKSRPHKDGRDSLLRLRCRLRLQGRSWRGWSLAKDDAQPVAGALARKQADEALRLATQQATVLRNELAHATRLELVSLLTTSIAHEVNQPLYAMASRRSRQRNRTNC